MEMNNCLVSIIIPVYNVGNYLKKCIESVIDQTYKEIEIILVDDGSTDDSHDICDFFSTKDDRIKVFHIRNQGVSNARNFGLNKSNGQYVTFIDGDDYVEKDYVQYFLNIALENQADFCISKNCFTKKIDTQIVNDHVEIMSPEDAFALLISPRIVVGCWNKFYKKEFLVDNNILFDTALFYGEGLRFITDSAKKAKRIVVSERKVYFYRKNNINSITTRFNVNHYYNAEKSLCLIENDNRPTNKKIEDMFLLHKCNLFVGAVSRLIAFKCKREYKSDYNRWIKYVRKSILKVSFSKYIPFYRKSLITFGAFFPRLISILDKRRRIKIISESI